MPPQSGAPTRSGTRRVRRLIACVRTVGQDAAGDSPYTQSFAVVHRLRDGLIVEADYYLDRGDALEAVGLRENEETAQ